MLRVPITTSPIYVEMGSNLSRRTKERKKLWVLNADVYVSELMQLIKIPVRLNRQLLPLIKGESTETRIPLTSSRLIRKIIRLRQMRLVKALTSEARNFPNKKRGTRNVQFKNGNYLYFKSPFAPPPPIN